MPNMVWIWQRKHNTNEYNARGVHRSQFTYTYVHMCLLFHITSELNAEVILFVCTIGHIFFIDIISCL